MELLLQAESAHHEGRTQQYGYRLKQLQGLHQMLFENQTKFLEALQSGDKKSSIDSLSPIYRSILNVVAIEGTRLQKLYKRLEKQSLSTVSSRSVLIVGDQRDPLGSIVSPLTFAISSGSCAVINPNERAPAIETLLSALVPRYLDREAFSVIHMPSERALELDFKTVVLTGQPAPRQPKSGTKYIERHVGLNVLCHIDNSTEGVSDCADALVYSNTLGAHPAAIDVALILTTKVDTLKAEMSTRFGQHPIKIREENLDYLSLAWAGTGPVLIAVTSTEDVILQLSKMSVHRFTYFGDKSYGEYLIKFLPAAASGSINTYHLAEFYSDIHARLFESYRQVAIAERPSVGREEEKTLTFPELVIDYSHGTPFFMQGLKVSNYIAYSTVATVLALVGWRVAMIFY